MPEGAVVLSQKNKKTQKPDFALFDEFWNEMKKDNIEQTVLPDELNSLRKKIVNELSPKKIVLFGSRARGDFKKNSDIDIAVDTQKNIEMTEISEAVDIVNINKVPNEFKEKIEKEENFPSTARIALLDWLENIPQEVQCSYKSLFKNFDEQLYFEENLREEYLKKYYLFKDDESF
ncbi:nucleotidyltransferase domain-containing protein [Peptococcaceae bacterium]|nr:nucleotidyltransferase domain-containing protein [Peptococcaceae bacterium]